MSSEFDYYGNAKSIYRIDALTKNNNGISELEYKFKKSSIIFIFLFIYALLVYLNFQIFSFRFLVLDFQFLPNLDNFTKFVIRIIFQTVSFRL